MSSAPTLGIDLGTTNSVCSVVLGDEKVILENEEGDRMTPSVVYFRDADETEEMPLIGRQADNKAEANPERVVRSIKREMGDSIEYSFNDEYYSPEEISSYILRKIRTDAAKTLGVDRDEELTDAVITVPAYFSEDERAATINAGKLAGFESIRIIDEPTAAALAYGQLEWDNEKLIAVYDLGGGTFDFSLVELEQTGDSSGADLYQTLAKSGDSNLGGDDWDTRIVEWLTEQFEDEHGVDPLTRLPVDKSESDVKIRHERMRHAARDAKEQLSADSTSAVTISEPFFATVDDEVVGLEYELTQTTFEELTEDLVERTITPIENTLGDVNISRSDIDEVILVGGSTRMPQVQQLITEFFETEPRTHIRPDEAVSLGAAIEGNKKDILLLEVTPLSLGIGVKGDRFKRMVRRNTEIPTNTSELFTTSEDNQTSVRIPVYQGEREIASENRHLKTLLLTDIPPGKKNATQIKVDFNIQKNGIINVKATDKTTGKVVSTELKDENQLSDEEVENALEEAKEKEEYDRKRKKAVEAKNNAEALISETERILHEYGHAFDEATVNEIEAIITNIRHTLNNPEATLGDLNTKTEKLNQILLDIGSSIREEDIEPREGTETHSGNVTDHQPGSDDATSMSGTQAATEATQSTGGSESEGTAESWWDESSDGVEDGDIENNTGSGGGEDSPDDTPFDFDDVESDLDPENVDAYDDLEAGSNANFSPEGSTDGDESSDTTEETTAESKSPDGLDTEEDEQTESNEGQANEDGSKDGVTPDTQYEQAQQEERIVDPIGWEAFDDPDEEELKEIGTDKGTSTEKTQTQNTEDTTESIDEDRSTETTNADGVDDTEQITQDETENVDSDNNGSGTWETEKLPTNSEESTTDSGTNTSEKPTKDTKEDEDDEDDEDDGDGSKDVEEKYETVPLTDVITGSETGTDESDKSDDEIESEEQNTASEKTEQQELDDEPTEWEG